MKRIVCAAALIAHAGLIHALSGQVTDTSGRPVANALVDVADSRIKARTDEQGRFELDTRGIDVHEIHVKAAGYSHVTMHPEEGQQSVSIQLSPTVIEQVDVTATPFHASIIESAQPVSVIAGEELRRKQASTLGETLKNEVGVHSSYFGPVVSTPIIRGLDGPRVLITQNGLDVSDASRVGPDHVVSTESTTAQQIEILRGPATLFYGSGAIGGVVNVVDNRVPTSNESRGAYSVQHNTVADEYEAALSLSGGTEQVAFHIDGFWRDGDNYDIPGEAVLETEEEHEEEGHEEHKEGELEDSASESKGVNLGASWLFDNGHVGLSYGHMKRSNGVPGHGHGEEHEEDPGAGAGGGAGAGAGAAEEEHEHEEGVRSDLQQNRWQLISELSTDHSFIRGVHTRLGYTDYEHVEIEDGEKGTIFNNQSAQARVDLLLEEISGWHGALSFEAKTSDFEAQGEEAFTPPSRTDSYAVAFIQEKHVGNVLWQLGARVESVTIDAEPIEFHDHHEEAGGGAGAGAGAAEEEEELHFEELEFTPYSLSAGAVWDFMPGYNAAISLTHAQRAPSAAELFSYGPHIGTGTFEVGALFDIHQEGTETHVDYIGDAEEEVSNNIDLSLRKHSGNIGWVVTAFYNEIDNFYYQRFTGLTSEDLEEEHDAGAGAGAGGHEEHHHGELPVTLFEQADAKLYGLEGQFAWQFAQAYKFSLWGDTTRGELKDGGNLPRIPPTRIGTKLRYGSLNWGAELQAVHYFEQDKLGELETETDAYTLLDAEVSYTFVNREQDLTLFLKGSNLSDEEARVHSSFLKDKAPLPGRGFSVGVRGMF